MSAKGVISKDLHESIRNVLGRNVKVSLKCLVRMEIKPEKTENRVLAFSACRLFILTAKVPTKIEHTFHYLDIQSIESKKTNQLSLAVDSKIYTFHSLEAESEDVDHMIIQLGTAIKSIFPQVPLDHVIRKLDVVPPSRIKAMLEYNQDIENKDPGPCGGYSTQYACMCDYHGLPYREEVAWDVDTIYLSHDSKELSLLDFDHLDGKDLVPIISALSYNAWFTKFRASNTRLISEALEQLILLMKRSLSIEELYLDNIGVKWDFAHKLSLALIANPSTPLHTLDLSNNLIEDKGIGSLCGIIAKIIQGAGQLSGAAGKLQKGLIHLNLARTGITAKGVNTLAHALSLNRSMPSTLTYLNLSDNVFKEDVNNLYNFLAQPNSLTHLDLSGTEVSLETVFGALLRGCTQKLAVLHLARNQFSGKKSKEVNIPPSFKAFFSSTSALKYLNMSNIKVPAEALKAMLLGLACNEIATDVALDISNNDLRSPGALVLESCLPGIRCLCSLDISENAFDLDLANIVLAVGKNKSLKHLSIGRNFTNVKAKHLARVMDAVVQVIQEEDSVLESLSLAESKLRNDLCMVINALGSNQCLTSIDITGNGMGPAGAKTLAKALQINSKLRCILWDRNNTTPQGFQDIAYALEKNYTLRYMPCPIHDSTVAMKLAPEKTEMALRRIEELLHRNVSPKKFCNGQAFRLQQGFLLSSTQQMVDRLMVRVQDAINGMKRSSTDEEWCLDVEKAEGYLHDANNAKQLLTRLHEVVLQQEESGNPVELKLQDCVNGVNSTLESYLKGTAACMLKSAEENCPNVMSDEKIRQDIIRLCQERCTIPTEIVRESLLDQAGSDIMNKISEVNLSVAAHISDRILDEVIESLSRTHRGLVSDDRSKQQRSSTPDVLRSRSRGESNLRVSRSGESQPDQDSIDENSDSPLATPKLPNKRKSVHCRKLRPQSVVDSVEGIAADDIPDLLPKESEDNLPSLSPSSEKLEHLGKARPKRPKTRAPTRPCIQSKDMREDAQDLGEGLDTFFTSQPNSSSTPTLSPDSEEPRPRTSSNSTITSGNTIVSECEGSQMKNSQEKISPEKDTEKKGFIRGITSLFSRVAIEAASIHKSKSYEVSMTTASKETIQSPVHRGKQLGNDADVGCDGALETTKEEASSRLNSSEKLAQSPGAKSPTSGLMVEMRARQEKRASSSPQIKQVEEKQGATEGKEQGTNMLQAVKLKATGLAESLKSPTDGFPKEKTEASPTHKLSEDSPSSGGGCSRQAGCRPASSPCSSLTPGGSPQLGDTAKGLQAFKPRPPPIAPKPRPKSMLGAMEIRLSGEFVGIGDDGSEGGDTPKSQSPDESDNFERNGEAVLHSTSHSSDNTSNKEATPRVRSMYTSSDSSGNIDLNTEPKGHRSVGGHGSFRHSSETESPKASTNSSSIVIKDKNGNQQKQSPGSIRPRKVTMTDLGENDVIDV